MKRHHRARRHRLSQDNIRDHFAAVEDTGPTLATLSKTSQLLPTSRMWVQRVLVLSHVMMTDGLGLFLEPTGAAPPRRPVGAHLGVWRLPRILVVVVG